MRKKATCLPLSICPAIIRNKVINMYPWKPLIAIPQGAAGKKFIGRHHFGHGAAALTQHHAKAHGHHPRALFGCLPGSFLPVPGNTGQKIIAGLFIFGEDFIGPAAVIAGSRSAEKGDGLIPPEGADHLTGGQYTAVINLLFITGGPALENRRPSQVDDGTCIFKFCLPCPAAGGVR